MPSSSPALAARPAGLIVSSSTHATRPDRSTTHRATASSEVTTTSALSSAAKPWRRCADSSRSVDAITEIQPAASSSPMSASARWSRWAGTSSKPSISGPRGLISHARTSAAWSSQIWASCWRKPSDSGMGRRLGVPRLRWQADSVGRSKPGEGRWPTKVDGAAALRRCDARLAGHPMEPPACSLVQVALGP